MAKESYQKKLDRVRPPRVQIKYEVDTGDATVIKELPFVVGVMGDFSGHPTEELPDLQDRSFVEIDRDNFNEVLEKMTPGINIRVDNKLDDGDSELGVQLKFKSMDDFSPANVAKQVPALKALMDTRDKLKDLAINVDRRRDLQKLIEEILSDPAQQQKLAEELGIGNASSSDEGE